VERGPERRGALDEIKHQFVEQIKLRAYDDRYLDINKERELLMYALHQGATREAALAFLAQVCEREGYVLESAALAAVKDLLEIQANNDGKIDEKEFNDAVALLKMKTQGKKNDIHYKRLVLEIIDDHSYKVKTGFFSNWHSRVKREVGMA